MSEVGEEVEVIDLLMIPAAQSWSMIGALAVTFEPTFKSILSSDSPFV